MHSLAKWLIGSLLVLVLLTLTGVVAVEHYLPQWIRDTVASRTGRELKLGDVEIIWSPHPGLRLRQASLANADWSARPQMLKADVLSARLDLLRALGGELVLPEIEIRGARIWLEHTRDGRRNWDMRSTDRPSAAGPVSVPEIQHLIIDDTRVNYTEPGRDTDLTVTLQSHPDSGQSLPLKADGKGHYRNSPFLLRFRGDPLQQLYAEQQRYTLKLQVTAADTLAQVSGQILNPQQLTQAGLNLHLRLAGPNMERLTALTGLALPSLPPYQIQGQLHHQGEKWTLRDLNGKVGDSDLQGSLSLDLSQSLPLLSADLTSQRLDFDDLGVLTGAPPQAGPGETASERQAREQRRLEKTDRVLPDDPLDLEHLRRMNASVHFIGKHVQAGKLPVDQVQIRFQLEDGELDFTPLTFHIGGGQIRNTLHIDASHDRPTAKWEAELEQIDLRQVFRDLDMADDSVGRVGGRAKLWLQGRSVAEMLSTADGGLYLLMSGGTLDHLLVEVAGLDVTEAIGTWLTNQAPDPIDCAYADLQARSGTLNLETFIVDTPDTLFTADGKVDFGRETLDIGIYPRPKDTSLLSARSPLRVSGTLGDPTLRPGSEAVVKGLSAVALTAVAGPVAALVPLIETGPGGEARVCNGLVSHMQTEERRQDARGRDAQ